MFIKKRNKKIFIKNVIKVFFNFLSCDFIPWRYHQISYIAQKMIGNYASKLSKLDKNYQTTHNRQV